ncbi:MAG: AsmA family protein [Bacteroidia bacterium]|nr:AsmA family protein [Bacteroidia bacterium]MDW8236412.1 AsmA-like C-terminal region-containing protein [Bacteroidia bacterium]
MRKVLWIVGGLLAFLLAALVVLPFLLRGKIDALLKAQINKNVNAQVDYQQLSLSFFRHFPALTLRLEGLSVVNKEPFAGDTLLACEAIDIGVDVLKAIRGQIEITRFYLIRPRILVQVLADGKASWDIAMPDTTQKETAPQDTSRTAFSLSLRRYEIQEGVIVYADSATKMEARLIGLTHTGKGNLSLDETILETDTKIDQVFFAYGGTSYLKGQRLQAGIDVEIQQPASRYTLRRGELSLNDLHLRLTGSIQMPDTLTTLLDMRFEAPGASLKELLSLVPAVYRKGYESLSTEGTLRVEGFVQGALQDTLLPAFGANIQIDNGAIRYKDLPQAVEGLTLRLTVRNPASTLESLLVDLDTLALRMGQTSLALSYHSQGLSVMRLAARASAKGSLSDFAKALPLGYELKGDFDVALQAQGLYGNKRLPAVQGYFTLREGYVKAADFPMPVEQLAVDFQAESPDASPARTTAHLKRLYALLGGKPIEVSLLLQDLEALGYNLTARGEIDLDAWLHVFPLDSTELKGLLALNLQAQGSRAALEKKDFARLPTQGSLSIQNLSYRSPSLPQGLTIAQARLDFSPRFVALTGYKGTIGKSDLALEGKLENFLGYVLQDEKIIGSLTLSSNRMDLNEWMSSDTAQTSSTAPDTSRREVVVVPANIDFTFQAQVGELLYERMRFQNARGRIVIRDQAIRLEGFEMQGFGGSVALAGSYIAPDKKNARWDMQFRLQQVEMQQVVPHFPTMQRLAPIVQSTQGQINLSLSAASALKPDFTPDLATMSGTGMLEVLRAVVQGSAGMSAIASATRIPSLSTLQLGSTRIQFKIQNGELLVEPFKFNAGDIGMEVGGVTRLDRSIAYKVGIDVPAAAATGFLQAAGVPMPSMGKVRLIANMGGTTDNPRVTGVDVASGEGSGSATTLITTKVEEAKARAEEQMRRYQDSVQAALRAREDSIRQALEQKRREEEERLRREAEERRRQEEERLRQQIEEEKKKATEQIKKNLPFPR